MNETMSLPLIADYDAVQGLEDSTTEIFSQLI